MYYDFHIRILYEQIFELVMSQKIGFLLFSPLTQFTFGYEYYRWCEPTHSFSVSNTFECEPKHSFFVSNIMNVNRNVLEDWIFISYIISSLDSVKSHNSIRLFHFCRCICCSFIMMYHIFQISPQKEEYHPFQVRCPLLLQTLVLFHIIIFFSFIWLVLKLWYNQRKE